MPSAAPIPFTPPHVSVNRVRVLDLPGVAMDDEVRGQTGFQLLSVTAMARYARQLAGDLGLPQAFEQDSRQTMAELPYFIAASLASPDALVREAADAVVQRLGRNLGHVVLALHRGDKINREAREEWTGADWDRWARIERVWLAGGLTSGALGEAIVRHARAWLVEVESDAAIDLQVSPYCGATSLAGAARYLPPADGHCLVLDFGQTSAKRALVNIAGSAAKLTLLPPVRSPGERPAFPDPDLVASALRQKAFMVDILCASLEAADDQGFALRPDIMVCLAAYVDGGRLVGRGDYNTLMELTSDVRALLADTVAARTDRLTRIHLIHDGTAAAGAFAGQPNTAVIALGTALGVGFAPASPQGLLHIDEISNLYTNLKGSTTDAH